MVKLKEASIIKERENFFSQIKKIRVTLSSMFSDFTDVYIADSTPIVICKISRANRSAIRTTDEIKHSFGCRIAHKSRYFGSIDIIYNYSNLNEFKFLTLHL